MLLENITYHQPHVKIRKFEYRARNPLVVGRPLSTHAHQKDEATFRVWCEDELDGFVGMTGEVVVEPMPEEDRPQETESGVQV
jgi:hydroxyacyl-ACP dehydratase HTD2-like protein with hotdog domain